MPQYLITCEHNCLKETEIIKMLFPFVEIFCFSDLYDFVYKSYSLTTVPRAVEDSEFSYTLSLNHLIIA